MMEWFTCDISLKLILSTIKWWECTIGRCGEVDLFMQDGIEMIDKHIDSHFLLLNRMIGGHCRYLTIYSRIRVDDHGH